MERRHYLICLSVVVVSVMACLMPFQLTAQTKSQTRQYTEEHPLIYEDGLDIWPYSYLNEQGEPEGFNIDLVRLLCEDLDIPVEIRLVPTYDAMRDLHEGKSDLMISGSTLLEHDGVHTSKSTVQLFTQSVVFPIGKQHVKELKDLGEQQVYVHNHSFTHRIMKERGWDANAIAYDDMREAVQFIHNNPDNRIVWNTICLKWLLEKFQFDPLHTKISIPEGSNEYSVYYADGAGTIPVNFKAQDNGRYTLDFSTEEIGFNYLHLIDNMNGNDVNLLETPYYAFDAKSTDYASRFTLIFATGIDKDETFAFFNNGNWIINNDGEAIVQVVDALGRVLSSETISGSCSKAINATPGVYMLRLINGDNVKVQKIIVNR